MKEAAEKEWEAFKVERAAGIEEITHLREHVAEEEQRKKAERREANTEGDVPMDDTTIKKSESTLALNGEKPADVPPPMEVDDEERPSGEKEAKKEPSAGSALGADAPGPSQAGAADEDDAVEY